MRYYNEEKRNELYNPDVYPEMLNCDAERMDTLNSEYGYGITKDALLYCIYKYRKAWERNDLRTMSTIEYRLTDINFHYECGLLAHGEFDKCIQSVKNW